MNAAPAHRGSRTASPRRPVRLALSVAALIGVVGLAGCTIGDTGSGGPKSSEEAGPQAVVNTSFTKDASDVNPTAPVVLTADHGTLTTVQMTNPEGQPVKGEFNAERTEWRATEPLGYGKKYAVASTATDPEGRVTDSKTSFTTLSPKVMTAAYLVTGEGTTVGIGQPVAVMFDEPIKDRRAAQSAIHVTTTPAVEGAFYWVSDQEVRWRPEKYWAPGTKVDVKVDIYGKDLGGGMYGQENAHSDFTIGDAVISRVDDATKQIVVERNGEVVKTMPTSMGDSANPTPNGTYIVGDKRASMIMDSSTYGVPSTSPNGYRTPVQYATQMSYNGIYVHAAPWSVWAQGSTNTSHGCLNVSTANAEWFYENSTRGDIVEVTGTVGGTLSGVDGLGDWNIPWATWKAGNADGA